MATLTEEVRVKRVATELETMCFLDLEAVMRELTFHRLGMIERLAALEPLNRMGTKVHRLMGIVARLSRTPGWLNTGVVECSFCGKAPEKAALLMASRGLCLCADCAKIATEFYEQNKKTA